MELRSLAPSRVALLVMVAMVLGPAALPLASAEASEMSEDLAFLTSVNISLPRVKTYSKGPPCLHGDLLHAAVCTPYCLSLRVDSAALPKPEPHHLRVQSFIVQPMGH